MVICWAPRQVFLLQLCTPSEGVNSPKELGSGEGLFYCVELIFLRSWGTGSMGLGFNNSDEGEFCIWEILNFVIDFYKNLLIFYQWGFRVVYFLSFLYFFWLKNSRISYDFSNFLFWTTYNPLMYFFVFVFLYIFYAYFYF